MEPRLSKIRESVARGVSAWERDDFESALATFQEVLDEALKKLKRRGCKVIWLNPLKGWKGYEPVARGMAAALPHLDHFEAAATWNDLAALEHTLARL